MTAKTLITALSIGRILVGLGLTAAPAKAGAQWIGRAAKDPATGVMVRGLGVRDLALGVATIGTLRATGTKGMGFKVLVALGILCDAVDAAATLEAADALPMGGKPTVAVATSAAAVGAISLLRP